MQIVDFMMNICSLTPSHKEENLGIEGRNLAFLAV